MIDSAQLLSDLQREVSKLEDDLRARCDGDPSVDAPLKAQYEAARASRRTALTYKAWREEELTNIAVAWVLACVFVRFLEDNGLVDTLHLAGPDAAGLARARDQHELFFREHPNFTEREYLEHVFTATAALPAMAEFFDRRHNPLWSVGPTGDAAVALVNFWRRADLETGRPVHDFSDPEWNTRFLGDLYQDLSAAARKRYALLQTPGFIEQFILDRTLTPAIETFGFRVVRMIDPTCGSGHFLLGGFARLHRLWLEAEPGESAAVLAQRALDQVFGVDLNPNVVAIARFRLLLAALRATGTTKLRHTFNFRINVATGDALLHGRRFREFESNTGAQRTFDSEELFRDELKHHYEVEDIEALHRILGQQYHAVVGNPPYITVKDRALSELYRARFPSCHGKYSLSVPFMERFFDLAVKGEGTSRQPAGFVGQITANSFMKREFGKKIIEEFFPDWDVTHILDTSRAHIPGHGTPTVILFGRNQAPTSSTIRCVLGIKGEAVKPDDPPHAPVWTAIAGQVDRAGSVGEFVSVADVPRTNFSKHPWSVGGGGVAELKEQIEMGAESFFGTRLRDSGMTLYTGEDEVFLLPPTKVFRLGAVGSFAPLATGEDVRHYELVPQLQCFLPYNCDGKCADFEALPSGLRQHLWNFRTHLRDRVFFGKSMAERNMEWFEHAIFFPERFRAKNPLAFPYVATHNNFVVQRGTYINNRHCPLIILNDGVDESDVVAFLGLFNSSTAGFWMKQVFHDKGGGGIGGGLATEEWEHFFEFNGSKLALFPIPARIPASLADAILRSRAIIQGQSPAAILASWQMTVSERLQERLASAREEVSALWRKLTAWQEELDWQIYEAFGLVASDGSTSAQVAQPEGEVEIPPEGLELGQRAFEIVLARQMVAGEVNTTWFERHGSTAITEVPSHWTTAYRQLVERRIARIESDSNIRLIERPEYKRRWNTEPWDEQFQKAARDWLLARLEGYFYEGQRVCELKDRFAPAAAGLAAATRPAVTTTNQLASVAQADGAFLAVAEQLLGGPGFSVLKLVRDLVESAAVPFLPVLRYKPSGLLKRRDWEHVWDLQRKEDAIDRVERVDEPNLTTAEQAERKAAAAARKKAELGEIPVPPKYGSGDFKKSAWWSLRGKLDVPKERWVSYPGAERTEDPSPVIAWAGWDHAQQARALAEYYLEAKQNYGFPPEKLKLLLAGLADLSPWLRQWHSAIDPAIGDSPANAIRAFLDAECHALGATTADLESVRMGS